MQISEAGAPAGPGAGGAPSVTTTNTTTTNSSNSTTPVGGATTEPCRFPKLEECAHFHYERVHLPKLAVQLQTNVDQSLHSQHANDDDDTEWYMIQVTSGDQCWLLQRNFDNFKMLDAQLHQCIYDRKIFQLPDLSSQSPNDENIEEVLRAYLDRFSDIANSSINCGPVLNWLQMDNKGHRLLVPSEESRSINTPAVAAAYGVRRYVSQAIDELNLDVGDMISVIDMASPGESMWWRGKRGFQVGFFPQHCVQVIGDKVPRNMPLPPPVVGSLALSPIKPVLRKHGKIITFFRSFILNRPSRRRLKQSGILKERVFGCDLGEHLLNSGHDIPMVLKCCAEFIESHGIVDGIYRLSGVTSNIQKLRNAFDEDRIPNLYTDDILQDIHSVASLLKMYFRELPNPLCTYQLYQSFVNAVQGCNSSIRNSDSDHDRLLKMREAVQKLPPPHYRTLEYLMRHLARVAKHGASTGMTTRNVAIVWAPNLLRCAELEVGGVAALQGVGVQAVVTEFLICYAHLIFCDRLPNMDLPTILSSSGEHRLIDPSSGLSPKRSAANSSTSCRPKSLAISTPTKLITLEEARSKHLLLSVSQNKNSEDCCGYIEVGGGPKNLPKKYHTVIELPGGGGARKRQHAKRSPLGWRSLFSKSRNSSQGNLSKSRKASTPGIIISDKSVTECDLSDIRRKLRSVKSAESLTSGHSEPASNEIDVLGPLYSLNKPPGHNRSVSHDSYFDTLQTSQNNSEGSLLDLSEIQLNFELEESEMRIFSEDESLVSSPRIQRGDGHHGGGATATGHNNYGQQQQQQNSRRVLTRARPEEFGSATNSGNPSPKKQPRVVPSMTSPPPDSATSRKRTRLEDQLGDIQFIDCGTPDNNIMVCDSNNSSGTTTTTALVHQVPASAENLYQQNTNEKVTSVAAAAAERSPDSYYQPKNKSPRNSHHLDAAADDNNKCQQTTAVARHLKRQSLNLEQHNREVAGTTRNINNNTSANIPKSYTTETDLGNRAFSGAASVLATPTPQSPAYRQLGDEESSTANTTPDSPLADITYQHLNNNCSGGSKRTSSSNNYENILTTISITYKSPPRSVDASPVKRSPPTSLGNCCYDVNNSGSSSYGYENVLVNVETAVVPTSAASLPDQGAAQPIIFQANEFLNDTMTSVDRPKSTSALEDRESSTTLSNHSNDEGDQEQPQTLRPNLSSDAICDTSEQISMVSLTDQRSLSSNHSSRSNVQYTASSISSGGVTVGGYRMIENAEQLSPTDLSLSEVVQSSTENLSTSHTSMSFPLSVSRNSTPNVSPTQIYDNCLTSTGEGLISEGGTRNTSEASLIEEAAALSSSRNNIDLIEFSPTEPENNPSPSRIMGSLNDKRKSSETEPCDDDSAIYQQVKVLRRSVHEVNALLDLEKEKEKKEGNLKDFPSEDVVDHPTIRLQQSSVQYSQFTEGNSEPQIEELDCTRKTEKDAKIGTKVPEEIRDLQENDSNVVQNLNYDSLEAENVHVYENMNGEELRRDHDCNVYENIEISNNSSQENDRIQDKTSDSSDVMKDGKVSSEVVANLNSGGKASQDSVEKQEDLSADVVVRNKVCVKDLTNRFEDRSSNNSSSQESNGTNVNSVCTSLLPTHVTAAAAAGDTTITTSNTSSVLATKDSSSIIKNSDSSDRRRTGENDSSSSVSTNNLLSTNDDNDGSSSSNTDVVISTTIMTSDKPKKLFYEKDSLPPCLRARNLKHQMKTRSLDEEEFKKEFSGVGASESDISCARSGSYCKKKSGGGDLLTFSTNSMDLQGRRKSMDEVGGAGMGYKTNSLPKTLNQPKLLPTDGDKVSSMIHLAHSTENLSAAEEEQKKRERIEKYKEERRKFLQDKYRSESFKEDKDVLISKLKLFSAKQPKEESNGGNLATVLPPQSSALESAVEKNLKKEEVVIRREVEIEQQMPQIKLLEAERTRTRRRSSSTKSDDSAEATVLPVATKHSPEILGKNGDFSATIVTAGANVPSNKVPSGSSKLPAGGPGLIMMTESLKSRAAMFERATTANQRSVSSIPSFIHTAEQPKKSPVCKKNPNAANNSSNTGALLLVGQGQKSDLDDVDVEILRRKKEDCTPGWSHLKNNNVCISSSSSNEKRRHTYESGRRERELLADQSREIIGDVTGATNNTAGSRRISLDTNKSPRREKSSPTYCIKDMKAIFESKSKQ